MLVLIGVAGLLAYYLITHWNDIKAGLTVLGDWFVKIWHDIQSVVGTAVDWIMKKIQPLINAINTVIGGVSSVGHAIGGAVSSAASLLVPHFASGGIVNGPTLALVGEAGPEAIIPLSAFSGGSSLGSGGIGGGGNVVININGGTYLDQNASRMFADYIAKTIGQQLKLRSI
jgi:hypothetical protein